jgi:hypothetical protein
MSNDPTAGEDDGIKTDELRGIVDRIASYRGGRWR